MRNQSKPSQTLPEQTKWMLHVTREEMNRKQLLIGGELLSPWEAIERHYISKVCHEKGYSDSPKTCKVRIWGFVFSELGLQRITGQELI